MTNVTSQSLKWACAKCDKACGSSVLHFTKTMCRSVHKYGCVLMCILFLFIEMMHVLMMA